MAWAWLFYSNCSNKTAAATKNNNRHRLKKRFLNRSLQRIGGSYIPKTLLTTLHWQQQ